MFKGFTTFTVTTQKEPLVSIYGLKSGDPSPHLPPLLLLHGFPQCGLIWHRVAPQLTAKYTVVILDLRGYGESSKLGEVWEYAKSAMARDCAVAMEQLGHKSFYICAHDRGARVAHKLCVDYPERVRKAIFLDICPTLAMYTATDFEFAKAYFHWFFLIQKEPLPETLITASPRQFAELFMGGRQTEGLGIFDHECFEYYVKTLGNQPAVHAMCQDYRASSTLDLDEAREDLRQRKLIRCPIRVIWGKLGVIEKCFDAVKEWRQVTEVGIPVEGLAVDAGHYLPEQAHIAVVHNILEFCI